MASTTEMSRRFAGLSLQQIQQLLKATNLETHRAGTVLFRTGDKSQALYILLTGELLIKDGETELAQIKPVDIVGEMGIITDAPRSASVQVGKDATLLSLVKLRLDMLLKNDVIMAAQIYRNMLDSLIEKLKANNERQKVGAF